MLPAEATDISVAIVVADFEIARVVAVAIHHGHVRVNVIRYLVPVN